MEEEEHAKLRACNARSNAIRLVAKGFLALTSPPFTPSSHLFPPVLQPIPPAFLGGRGIRIDLESAPEEPLQSEVQIGRTQWGIMECCYEALQIQPATLAEVDERITRLQRVLAGQHSTREHRHF